MTQRYGEYTTIHDARKLYLGSDKTGEDEFMLQLIRQVSREIDAISKRRFYPAVETKKYDTPQKGYYLDLNQEIMTISAIVNGDGSSIDPTDVIAYPLNSNTFNRIFMPPTVSIWKTNNSFQNAAISITGTWCDVPIGSDAGWYDVDILADDIAAIDTSLSTPNDSYKAGMLLKIDDEMLYVSSVSAVPDPLPATTTTYTATVIRGVNGTTPAIHLKDAQTTQWVVGYDLRMLASAATIAYFNLRSNPMASKFTLDGVTFETPKDVTEFIRLRLKELNLIKVALA